MPRCQLAAQHGSQIYVPALLTDALRWAKTKAMNSVLAAFRFLAVGGRFDEAESRYEASALAALFFPLVGLVIGLGLAIVNRAFEPHLESELLAVVLTATMLFTTRAVHLDGTMKTFARLANGTSCAESGKPTDIHGLLVVLLVVILKIRAIEVIGDTRTLSLLLTPVLARWLLVIFLYGAAPDAEDSVAAVARNVRGWHLLVTTTATLVFAVYLVGRMGLWIGFWLSLFSLLSRSYLRRYHGAYSYDNLGALIELSETLSLVLFASL
ncbi:MAG: adenosylcobinamide-GDP ribazoletransferase [Deltaproteobacteria bacterium]|nr:adenosylcobinamide-GDP ribazoletransferase [Deltaproteobacteria bacterium]